MRSQSSVGKVSASSHSLAIAGGQCLATNPSAVSFSSCCSSVRPKCMISSASGGPPPLGNVSSNEYT